MTKRRKPDSRVEEEMLREEEIQRKIESILDEEDEDVREEMILGLDDEELEAFNEAMDEMEEELYEECDEDEEDECLNEFREPLYEMATVGFDEKLLLIVEVNPDVKRIGDEYFKVYNNISKGKAQKICRVLFRKPEYVKHRKSRGVAKTKKPWIMNSHERKNLVEFLNMRSDTFPELTMWQSAIVLFNIEKRLPRSKTMENFMDDLKYPEHLPIDLPMPDYTRLKNKKS